jgi:hypothetical protein
VTLLLHSVLYISLILPPTLQSKESISNGKLQRMAVTKKAATFLEDIQFQFNQVKIPLNHLIQTWVTYIPILLSHFHISSKSPRTTAK